MKMTPEELKSKNAKLYDDIYALGIRAEKDANRRFNETADTKGLIELKSQFKGSPLYDSINEIIESAIMKGDSPRDCLLSIARWTASGSALASLESPGDIGIGHARTASGEVAVDEDGKQKVTWE